jgi:hypothetical protein
MATTTATPERRGADRELDRGEWRALAILGLPTFALALAITTVTTYLPVIASDFAASTVVIGEGYAAMWAVCAVATLASIPLVRRLRDDAD